MDSFEKELAALNKRCMRQMKQAGQSGDLERLQEIEEEYTAEFWKILMRYIK